MNIHLNRKTITYLLLFEMKLSRWLAFVVKRQLVDWIVFFLSIVKSNHLVKEKSFLS